MVTPIERMARALTLSQSGVDDYDSLDEAMQDTLKEHCRAVLRAIREPSEAMIEEGAGVIPCGQGCEEGPANRAAAAMCWREMLDAALDEDEFIAIKREVME